MVELQYEVIRKPRIKTMTITVFHDNRVVVTVPKSLAAKDVKAFVDKKSNWIMKKLQLNKETMALHQPRRFTDGEEFCLLGRPFRLRIVLDSGFRRNDAKKALGVDLEDSTLCVRIPPALTEEEQKRRIQASLTRWYKEKALIYLEERVRMFSRHLDVRIKEIRIKTLKSRWGSCSSTRTLTFNWQILMASPELVDYVVVHELCHLVHMNHSRHFWEIVESILPDFKSRRLRLKEVGRGLCHWN